MMFCDIVQGVKNWPPCQFFTSEFAPQTPPKADGFCRENSGIHAATKAQR
jgi:hypothetical protein